MLHKRLGVPTMLMVEEHREHDKHIPFRSWCCHCIHEKPTVPEFHMEFVIMGGRGRLREDGGLGEHGEDLEDVYGHSPAAEVHWGVSCQGGGRLHEGGRLQQD